MNSVSFNNYKDRESAHKTLLEHAKRNLSNKSRKSLDDDDSWLAQPQVYDVVETTTAPTSTDPAYQFIIE